MFDKIRQSAIYTQKNVKKGWLKTSALQRIAFGHSFAPRIEDFPNKIKKCSLREQGAGSTKALLIRYFVSITYFYQNYNIYFHFIPIFYFFKADSMVFLIFKENTCSIRGLYIISVSYTHLWLVFGITFPSTLTEEVPVTSSWIPVLREVNSLSDCF